jgi:hypothetical protein
MYPRHELSEAASAKAALRTRIARRRAETAALLDRATRPLRWIDRARESWRQLGPLVRIATVPLGWWAARSAVRSRGLLGRLLRWGPTLFRLARGTAAWAARTGR